MLPVLLVLRVLLVLLRICVACVAKRQVLKFNFSRQNKLIFLNRVSSKTNNNFFEVCFAFESSPVRVGVSLPQASGARIDERDEI